MYRKLYRTFDSGPDTRVPYRYYVVASIILEFCVLSSIAYPAGTGSGRYGCHELDLNLALIGEARVPPSRVAPDLPLPRRLPTIQRSLLRPTGRRLTPTAARVVLHAHAMPKRARSFVDAPTLTLNSGHPHPQLGFGTYKVGFIPASASSAGGVASGAGDNAKDTVQAALELGYRFLDCAEFYGNEKAVGEAIAASGIPRSELFIASKVWSNTLYAGRDAIRAQVDKSLAELQIDYLDLYLVHWPVPGKHVLGYKHLEELVGEGKLRSIGLSNYTVEDYTELMEHARIPPAVQQHSAPPRPTPPRPAPPRPAPP
eukprot:SAG11_NODE_7662_length_1113_cov_1.447732_1_plen_313_part_01